MRAVVALILMAGCASIHPTESITDVPLDPSVSRGIRKESLQHEVTADIEVHDRAGGRAVGDVLGHHNSPAAAIVGLIDQARASDSEVDDGVIDEVIGKDEHTCRRRKTRQRAVSLVLTNGDRLEGVLDEQGVATLSFLPIPEEGAATDGPMFLLVDNARLRVDLTPDERKALHDALLSNPRSRVALRNDGRRVRRRSRRPAQ